MEDQSEQVDQLAEALAAVQGRLEPVKRDAEGQVGHQRYRFATFDSVWDACRQPLSQHGLAVVQGGEEVNGSPYLTTTLIHRSGQWIKGRTPIMVGESDRGTMSQAFGSAMTYARRQGLAAIVGITAEDDDGQSAGRPPQHEKSEEGGGKLCFTTTTKPPDSTRARLRKLGFKWSGEPDFHWHGPDTPEARQTVKELHKAGTVERYWLAGSKPKDEAQDAPQGKNGLVRFAEAVRELTDRICQAVSAADPDQAKAGAAAAGKVNQIFGKHGHAPGGTADLESVPPGLREQILADLREEVGLLEAGM